jgi:hypothetical protein
MLVSLVLLAGTTTSASATPQFAREYRVSCSHCHVAPPRLNQVGENFLARGYRFDDAALASRATVPLAVWNTFDVEYRRASDLTKGFFSRVEVISGGPLRWTGSAYFIELRALSQQIGAGNRLLNRSGRFEDAFVSLPLGSRSGITATVGQFRALSQVDVSRRLSLSEPLAFSTGIPDRRAAQTPRLTGLRGFSPSGRQPAVRLMHQRRTGTQAADGWYTAATVPLTGELTLPFSDAASFELEARPKGVFGETYYRSGMTSIGGHAFAGDRRGLAHVVVTSDFAARWSAIGAVGFDRARGSTSARLSVGGEYAVGPRLVAGGRLDHRSGAGRRPAVLAYVDSHLPFGPAVFRQAVRLQFEQTLQRNAFRSALALSHIF